MNAVRVNLVNRSDEYKLCRQIRQKVFIEEQNIPASIEVDSYEEESKHFMAYLGENPVSTGRVRFKNSYLKFERIATLKEYRGRGIGKILMAYMQEYCFQEWPEHLPIMHAQEEAVGFYLKLGWVSIGEVFYEADILHQTLIYPPKEKLEILKLKVITDSEADPDIQKYLNDKITHKG